MDTIVAVATIAVLAVVILGILLVSDWLKARNVGPNKRAAEVTRLKKQTITTLVLVAMSIGAAVVIFTVKLPQWSFLLLPMVLLAVFFVGFKIRAHIKYGTVIEAVKLAEAGDVEGGILQIRRALQAKPDSPDLWNTLAVLLIQQEEYEEAWRALERAEELGCDPSLVETNRAFVLWKRGRTEEALELNTGQCRRNPQNFVAAVNQCQILAVLERNEDAEQQLQVVERLCRSQWPLSTRERKLRGEKLEECRRKVEAIR